MEPTERLREAVAQIIGESGLSDAEFARQAGVDRVTLERIKEGQTRRPQKSTLSKISQASGRPWDALQRVLDEGEALSARRSLDGRSQTPHAEQLERLIDILTEQQRQLDALADRVRTLEDPDAPR